VTGDEETCKQAMTPTRAGEKVEMTHAHTIDLSAREEKQVTTNGVIKKRIVKEEQYDGLGDDKPVGSSTYENKRRTESIEDPEKPSALQVLKNFVDKIADQVKVHGSWLIILGIGVGLALALSIVAVSK
jgi:hypothetical protein